MKLEQLKKMIREIAKKEMNLMAVQNTQKSLKLESASRTAMEIGGLTGLNKDAVQKFVDTHKLDIEKVFQFVKKGKLSDRMDFVTAVSGKPNNPIQKKLIKKLQESVNAVVNPSQVRSVISKVKKDLKLESASRTAMEIGGLTGLNKDAVQKFVDTHKLDIEKVFQFVKKGNPADRRDFVTAVSSPILFMRKNIIKKLQESVNEDIKAFDERSFGKNGIIIMIDDNGKKVSAIFKNRKNADKYNRNKPEDLKTLVSLANKKGFGKAIDESVNEEKYSDQTGIKSSLLNDSEFTHLFQPKVFNWIRGKDVKIFKVQNYSNIFTISDGNMEIVVNISKPISVIKPYGRARREVKDLFLKTESVNEAKKYDIGSGYLGNGLTIWNRAEEKDGDYETIAHIGKDGKLTIYDKEIPADIKKMFGIWATSMKKGNRPPSY